MSKFHLVEKSMSKFHLVGKSMSKFTFGIKKYE